MNPWQPPQPLPTTPRKEIQIVGPRPTPLRVSKDSVKIKKPPKHPVTHQPPASAAQPPPPPNQPVIIYSVSPKPIYVDASNFRSLVQHLTGRDTVVDLPPVTPPGDPPVSPAARLAVLERASPKERDWRRYGGVGGGVVGGGGDGGGVDMMGMDDVGISQIPGILSPAPANLPLISPGMFSPIAATTTAAAMGGEGGQGMWGCSELIMSPFMSNISFLPSPSALLFSNSPTGEFFNIFDF